MLGWKDGWYGWTDRQIMSSKICFCQGGWDHLGGVLPTVAHGCEARPDPFCCMMNDNSGSTNSKSEHVSIQLKFILRSIGSIHLNHLCLFYPTKFPSSTSFRLSLSLSRSLSASDSISMWNLQGFNMNHWPTGGSIILAADGSLSLKVKSCGSDHVVTEAEPLSEIFSWRYPKGLSQSIF